MEEPYIPVYKILKEMYDEEKQAMYIYDSYNEYNYYDVVYNDYDYMFDEGDMWSEALPLISTDQCCMSDSEEQVQCDETASCFTSNKFYYY